MMKEPIIMLICRCVLVIILWGVCGSMGGGCTKSANQMPEQESKEEAIESLEKEGKKIVELRDENREKDEKRIDKLVEGIAHDEKILADLEKGRVEIKNKSEAEQPEKGNGQSKPEDTQGGKGAKKIYSVSDAFSDDFESKLWG